jgi:hypothetical protein
MNKTLVAIAFIALAVLGIVGVFLILLFQPDGSSEAIALVVTVLGIATTAIVTFYNLGKQGETIETIQRQTNGNTSALMAENSRLATLLAQAHAMPAPVVQAVAVAEAAADSGAARHAMN